eukprot:3330424-Pyramimonas_sp.AAC.1
MQRGRHSLPSRQAAHPTSYFFNKTIRKRLRHHHEPEVNANRDTYYIHAGVPHPKWLWQQLVQATRVSILVVPQYQRRRGLMRARCHTVCFSPRTVAGWKRTPCELAAILCVPVL